MIICLKVLDTQMNKSKPYSYYLKHQVKISPDKLAPKNAIPKYSKGDNAKHRFTEETIKLRGWGGTQKVNELYIPKGGYLVHKRKVI